MLLFGLEAFSEKNGQYPMPGVQAWGSDSYGKTEGPKGFDILVRTVCEDMGRIFGGVVMWGVVCVVQDSPCLPNKRKNIPDRFFSMASFLWDLYSLRKFVRSLSSSL